MKVFQLSTGTVLLFILPVSYFFLKDGGAPHIPFLVYICASSLELFIELYLLKRWINISLIYLFKKVFIPVLLVVACSLPISFFASYYLPFLLSVMFSGLSVCVSVYCITFTKENRAIIMQKINEYFKSKKEGNYE